MDLRTQPEPIFGVSLCAGYGGLDLGLHIAEPGYRTVAFVEREAHAAATLVARMEDSSLAQAPIWDDLKSFDGKPWRNSVHIVTAGYPCQPFSLSGGRRGVADPRHLWPDVARVAAEIKPEWVFCENVEGHISLGLADVAEDLRSMGYTPKAGMFSAREAGASHFRRRIFLLAHSNSKRRRLLPGFDYQRGDPGTVFPIRCGDQKRRPIRGIDRSEKLDGNVAGNTRAGSSSDPKPAGMFAPGPSELQKWERLLHDEPGLQPAVPRTADGLADRVERSRAAGNGVCSLAAAIAWRTLKADHVRNAVMAER